MRVHELVAEHGLLFPPPVFAPTEPADPIPTSATVRTAVLIGLEWREGDERAQTPGELVLTLDWEGREQMAVVPCPLSKRAAGRALGEVLQTSTGLTMAEILALDVPEVVVQRYALESPG